MRIESVTAVAFGPFRNKTLEFAPQLTVVYGPNEAGKSSWHAAIYAALCGMRRAKGQPKKDDKDFTERRRPWKGSDWEVRAIVQLDNRRRVELIQNLSDLAHCSAKDADLGRDVSVEILNEQTPDAAKWLGLDRESFLSVACVRQAEIQGVADGATSLQNALQRAAASAARVTTAAEAIARLEEFQRNEIGKDQSNSTRPLRRAKEEVASAEGSLANVQAEHAAWLVVEVQSLELGRKANEEQRKLRMLHALRARKEAESWSARLDRAQALEEKYRGGQPAFLSEDDALAADVAAAIDSWCSRPEVPVLTGPSSADIRAEVEALPPMPSGHQVPQVGIVTAMKAFERAVQALDLHQGHQPSQLHVGDAKGLGADQLRELARTLEMAIPIVDSELEASYREAQSRLEALHRSSSFRPLNAALAGAAVLGGAGLWAFAHPWIGMALVISGLAAFLWLVFRSGETGRPTVLEDLRDVEAQVLSQRKTVDGAREKISAARKQIIQLGLPIDSGALRELADGLVLAERNRQAESEWSKNRDELRSEAAGAEAAVAQLLRDAGVMETTNLSAAFQGYEQACRTRAEQAARAARRGSLERQRSDRESAEKAVREAEARRVSAEQKILSALSRCVLVASNPEAASEELQRWQTERRAMIVSFDEATREYAELAALLDGGTLDGLAAQASERQHQAAVLAAECGPLLEIADLNLNQEILRAERIAHDAAHAATGAQAQARERARGVTSVAEAEEALAAARQELERVTRLSGTLTLTLDFLRKAQESAHRDIAPKLVDGLRQRLSEVTQGRYRDARVNPSDLSVQVLGPDSSWQNARLLSYGTSEQIYLLLRAVLAEYLATTGETCPLILDDVLVQSDRMRKRALLELIVSISRERQVILFTQEEEVLQWAQANVIAPNQVVVLPGPAVAHTTI